MKVKHKSTIAIALGVILSQQVYANPERAESDKDTNVFQMEPSVINEKYYSNGENIRHQNLGKVLPYGAEIPSNDKATTIEQEPPRKAQTNISHLWTMIKNSDKGTKSNTPGALRFSNTKIETEIPLQSGTCDLPQAAGTK